MQLRAKLDREQDKTQSFITIPLYRMMRWTTYGVTLAGYALSLPLPDGVETCESMAPARLGQTRPITDRRIRVRKARRAL